MATKKRTTFAKFNRESKLREKRADKEARKAARRLSAAAAAIDLDSRPAGFDDAFGDADADTSEPAASAAASDTTGEEI